MDKSLSASNMTSFAKWTNIMPIKTKKCLKCGRNVNCILCIPFYTDIFKKFFYFFSKPVTKDTNEIIVVYQHLFAQICILTQDTKRYKKNEQAIPTLIRSNLYLIGFPIWSRMFKKLAIPTK